MLVLSLRIDTHFECFVESVEIWSLDKKYVTLVIGASLTEFEIIDLVFGTNSAKHFLKNYIFRLNLVLGLMDFTFESQN